MPKPPPTPAAFGYAVREAREASDLSQERLADAAELSQAYIWGIETGRRNPSLTVQAQIAAALQMRLSELVARAEQAHRLAQPPAKDG